MMSMQSSRRLGRLSSRWHITRMVYAFTLIELLVVVAIIVILIAVLMPSLGKARIQARAVVCGSHMRSVGQAMYAYTAEYSGLLPYGYYEFGPVLNGNPRYLTWDDLLNSYVGGTATQSQLDFIANVIPMALFTCPEDRFDRSRIYTTFRTRSYSMIHGLANPSAWPNCDTYGTATICYTLTYSPNPYFRSFKLTEIANPSLTLLLAERPFASATNGNILGHWAGAVLDRPTEQFSTGGVTEPYHMMKFNYLFADGHVEPFHPAQTIKAPKTLSDQAPNYMWRRDVDN